MSNRQEPNKLSIEEVDLLADKLSIIYDNVPYRAWYCAVIYEFGKDRVNYWHERAAGGDVPAKLFGFYVREARAAKPRPAVQKRETLETLDDSTIPITGAKIDMSELNDYLDDVS